jgi:hypothetical protein
MAQAIGNVGLSIMLCLLAVAAGHYGAVGVHRQHAVPVWREALILARLWLRF